MHSFLLLLPWLIAMIGTMWTKNYYLFILFVICAFFQLTYLRSLYKREKIKTASIITNYEHQTALLYELRKQRHDLQKHTSALIYADENTETVKRYKLELHSQYIEVDQVLQSETNITAGMLYAYHKRAKKNKVTLNLHIQHALSSMPLKEYEIVSLIGNILENAIEATSEFKEKTGEEGQITFTCRKQSGIWILLCKNQTLPLQNDTIDRIYTNRAITTKRGSHEGIGTQQIMRIVKEHQGTLDFSAIKETFTLKIKIPDVKNGAIIQA